MSRTRVVLSTLVPGVLPFFGGRRITGGVAFFTWLALLALAVLRWERVVAFVSGPLDGRIAVGTLAVGILGTMLWSGREAVRHEAGRRRADAGEAGAPAERWGPTARAFRRNKLAVAGLIAIVAFYLTALLTPLLAPVDPVAQGDLVAGSNLPPSWEHPLGTDQYARDVLSRLLYGARISLTVGFVAVAISVSIGTLIGSVAGYAGGRTDTLLMRFVDMVLSFPRLVLLIAVIAMLESPSIFLIITVLGLTLWPSSARIVRGEVLALREREFVEAARALGFSAPRILGRHVLPNALAPVIVAATLGIGNTIVLEAGLSFLGIGVQPPTPSWGNMVADGRTRLLEAWWISTFPGLAIVFVVLAFNLVGDGLRDALDPRLRGGEG
ncbi:MAG: ABC transporter permease [Longimicrobiales bacterium]|nr:ABC transporter permease [Longimicrobiales bacterium]